MKAIVQDRYGPLDEVLRVQDIDKPVAGKGEVLIRVSAASIHVGDVYIIQGVPFLFRPLLYGVRAPRARVPGTDLAGTVESVGPNVTRVGPGDEVFGWCKGAFAEHAVAAEQALALKPASLTFEQAAAVGVSAMTALQALRDHGHLKPGQRVLVNGASGGVGTFAVQIGKALGAEVTGVCSTRNVDMVRSIGADHVIDYATDDFTRGGQRYHLIFDNVGNHSLADTRKALTPDGMLLSNGAPVGGWFGGVREALMAFVSSIFVRQQGRPFVQTGKPEDLATLKKLIEAGKVTPVIDRTYQLDETAKAIAHVGERHAQGTTVISL